MENVVIFSQCNTFLVVRAGLRTCSHKSSKSHALGFGALEGHYMPIACGKGPLWSELAAACRSRPIQPAVKRSRCSSHGSWSG